MALERISINHSHKDIPTYSKTEYLVKLFDMTNKFLNKIRWALFWHEKTNETNQSNDELELDYNNQQYNIFPTKKSGPSSNKLAAFENDLFDMCKNIKFKKVFSKYQNNLRNTLSKLKEQDKVVIKADKTSNLYKMDVEKYNKLLFETVTAKYKKALPNTIDSINSEAESLICTNKIKGKIRKINTNNAFISIKDHKSNFPYSIKCRLLNPSKTSIGKISKNILDNINSKIRRKSSLQQWKNTTEVLRWFGKIKNKSTYTFIKFDVVEFYPNISKELLLKSIEFAKKFVSISKNDIDIIIHSCKTVLIYNNETWIKKDRTEESFDIPMGSHHGAEVCELVGLYILNELRSIIPKGNCGLYRDDGLLIVKKRSKRLIEILRKNITKTFKEQKLQIKIELSSQSVDFLDVTMNLQNDTYQPFRKENAKEMYVNFNSNHPFNIKKEIPKMIQKRLSSLSKTKEIFESTKTPYENALKNSGYQVKLEYDNNCITAVKKKRKRKKRVFYYNPPFCISLQNNIGKEFLKIVDKHFPKSGTLGKIFNRNTIKISYSCMPSLERQITRHNHKVLSNNTTKPDNEKQRCNCKNKELCPVNRRCLTKGVIYKATVNHNNKQMTYIGSTGRQFKKRFYEHMQSFRNKSKKDSTKLSKYIHSIDMNQGDLKKAIKWEFLHETKQRSPGKICTLCNLERLEIAFSKTKLLNSRSELVGKCKHFAKFYLKT